MKLIDIVEELVSEGHKITFRHRTDGGLIITSIDGKKYTSLTEGNRTARKMVVGGELSEARMTQVKFNVQKYIKLDTEMNKQKHKAKGNVDTELVKQLRKTQRAWRENDVKAGKITKRKLRYYIRTEGKQRAFEYLQSRERYAHGIAYDENVDFLIGKVKRLYNQTQNNKIIHAIDVLIEDMEQLKMNHQFLEKWIEPIHKVLGTSEGKEIPEDRIKKTISDIREIIGVAE